MFVDNVQILYHSTSRAGNITGHCFQNDPHKIRTNEILSIMKVLQTALTWLIAKNG